MDGVTLLIRPLVIILRQRTTPFGIDERREPALPNLHGARAHHSWSRFARMILVSVRIVRSRRRDHSLAQASFEQRPRIIGHHRNRGGFPLEISC